MTHEVLPARLAREHDHPRGRAEQQAGSCRRPNMVDAMTGTLRDPTDCACGRYYFAVVVAPEQWQQLAE